MLEKFDPKSNEVTASIAIPPPPPNAPHFPLPFKFMKWKYRGNREGGLKL